MPRSRRGARLVVVSNRLPEASKDGLQAGVATAGGLVSALRSTLLESSGAVWAGWSGKALADGERRRVRKGRLGPVELLGIDLTQDEVSEHYNGFCNRALWPLLHTFPGRVLIESGHREAYRSVNDRFAAALAPRLRPGDLVWIHDYHLFSLGAALRARGWEGKLGFFLHVPFPGHDVLSILPWAEELLADLLAYDRLGFHTQDYADNFRAAVKRELGKRVPARMAGAHPIGIDPDPFREWADSSEARLASERLRVSLQGRKLVLGVDRLDYTKGIPDRLKAFARLLELHPEWRRRVAYVQISAPSRTSVAEYALQRREVEGLVGRINGRLGEPDWTPIRYLFRSFSQMQLAGMYRLADVMLVSPLRDGMNLVAKEFVAAQPDGDPGVLVLSRFAGAAEELVESVLVNPYDADGTARGLLAALEMPWTERVRRQSALLGRVEAGTAARWAEGFLGELARGRS